MSAAHVSPFIAMIAGTGQTALAVYDARPSNPVYPYVIVYADAGVKSSDREADERVSHKQGAQTTVVGQSAAQCRAALDRVTARLENKRPTVSGYTCSKVEHETSQPIQADESLPDRVVFYATDQWSFIADPA